jgi:tetratricopeptide (TPR) repeat protein
MRILLAVALAAGCAGYVQAAPLLIATSSHFRVFAAEKESDLRTRAENLERYHAVLHRLTGAQDANDLTPLTIYVVPEQRDIGAGNFVLGYYSHPAAGPFAVVPARLNGLFIDSVPRIILFHEYAHHFMLANFPALYSPWFVEGFAEFYSTAEVSGALATVGKPEPLRIHTLMAHWSSPLEHLIAPTSPLSSDQTEQLYARAWLLVHYLTLSKSRGGQIEDYLRARDGGETERQAFQTAFHSSIDGIDSELKAYFATSTLSYVTIDTPRTQTIDVRPATPGEIVEMKLVPRLRHLQNDRVGATSASSDISTRNSFRHHADQLAEDARELARKYPDDAAVQEQTAECEMVAGQADLAAASADQAIKLDPKQSRARLALAEIAIARSKPGDAQSLLSARRNIVTANQLAPADPLPLIAYYRSFAEHGLAVPEIAVRGLERAHQLVPQDDDVRMLLAEERIAGKHYVEAASLLRPVALSPHDEPQRGVAQALLKTIPIAQEAAPQPIATDQSPQNARKPSETAAPAKPAA